MRELMLNCLPFAAIAVCAVILTFSVIRQAGRPGEGFMAEGMAIGMCFGVSLAAALHGRIAIGASFGLLLGEAIGLRSRKEEKK
ncbi:MAG: hypothetical protein IJV40_16445 [Oscillospiraceae bacterium]|nr:hypothetical protein [Oscillospiraceae bacterium]